MRTMTREYLGPATVLAAAGEKLRLTTPAGELEAELALAFPYRPEPGDLVLAIGGEEQAWVIGVIRGRGKTELRVPGDLKIAAGGLLSLSSARGIDLKAPHLDLRADRFEVTARMILERSLSCHRWVKKALQVTAGRIRTLVDGHATLHAERIVEQARKDVRIDGARINLG